MCLFHVFIWLHALAPESVLATSEATRGSFYATQGAVGWGSSRRVVGEPAVPIKPGDCTDHGGMRGGGRPPPCPRSPARPSPARAALLPRSARRSQELSGFAASAPISHPETWRKSPQSC